MCPSLECALKAGPARPPLPDGQLAGGGDASAAGQMTTAPSARSGQMTTAPSARSGLEPGGGAVVINQLPAPVPRVPRPSTCQEKMRKTPENRSHRIFNLDGCSVSIEIRTWIDMVEAPVRQPMGRAATRHLLLLRCAHEPALSGVADEAVALRYITSVRSVYFRPMVTIEPP